MGRRARSPIIGVLWLAISVLAHSQTPPPELWYWHHSYLNSPAAVQSSMALIDQAYAAGYTGVAFWDVSFEFLNSTTYLQQGMNYAISKGMKVLATGAPYGWSNDVLRTNPNWAEGQRIVGARFQVNAAATQLQLVNSFSGLVNGGFESGKTSWFKIGDAGVDADPTVSHSGTYSGVIRNAPANGRFAQLLTLTPWRQYHLRMYVKTQNYGGSTPAFLVFDASSSAVQRLYNSIHMGATQDWTQVDATFNSQSSTQAWLYFGEWGGSTGAIWFDDVSVEETALVNVLRRPGTPLKLYDPNTAAAFQEGKDFNAISDPQLVAYPRDDYHAPPTVTLPAGTAMQPGQTVALDFYAVQPVYSNQTGMCLTEAGVQNWLAQNAQAVTAAVPASAGYFLQYDEMRHMNSCASCKAKGFTPGQLLAWHASQTIGLYQSLRPGAPIYVWSDMFDPYHNAHDNYYLVEGDIAGSWLGLPANVTIMNWNLGDLKNSLAWFSGRDPRQPVPHAQIVAGYYDSGDGAAAAAAELQQALGVPGVKGLMYTSWQDDYSQLKPFADAVKNNWVAYQASVSASLSIVKTHTGNFIQGQQHAAYSVTVSNAANATPSSGTVTVTETLPPGLTLVSMSGTGWTCAATCTRADILNPGSSYPPITVTVNVAANASSPQVNMVSVNGGGSASDSTTIVPAGTQIGFVDMAGDAQGGATLAKGATLYVRGWAADTALGAPVQSVTVFVDGVSVGTATLGTARPD
ncbi:MAG: carbohydrate binding domain-containing protein, partial [Acidobacteriota bacterium]|nr:carbohydrate binding domain-containing protein [Acidobacteriota bacterium]